MVRTKYIRFFIIINETMTELNMLEYYFGPNKLSFSKKLFPTTK